jgi:L-alanine-DL-glutamate epimerase-like enolase superfamily enzyme
MRIENIEAIVLSESNIRANVADSSQDALIIRIYTDEGIVGLGEVDSSPYLVKAVIDGVRSSHLIANNIRDLLIGQDPFNVISIWDQLYLGTMYYGRRGVVIHAMSGIDIALWDIIGKALNRPICQLLGGARHSKIRAYASVLMPSTPSEVLAVVDRCLAEGFTAIKLGWGSLGENPKKTIELVKAARSAAGKEIEILIDLGLVDGRWDVATLVDLIKRLEEYEIFWIEEPLSPDDLEGYAKLAKAVDTRIATGEELSTRFAFRDLLDRGQVDVIQPDVTRVGGFTEFRRILDMAQLRGIPVVPHGWSTGIVRAANLQILAGMSNPLFLEYCVTESALNRKLVKNPFIVRNGFVDVPDGPGLGIDIDEDLMNKMRVR